MTQFYPSPPGNSPAFPVIPAPPNSAASIGIPPGITILQAMTTGQLPAQTVIFNLTPAGTSLGVAVSSGLISLSALAVTLQFAPAYTVTAITQAASAVVTVNLVSVVNPFIVGQTLYFSGINGMVQINNLYGTITAIGGSSGAWTATVNIASTGFFAFVAGSNGTVPPTVQVGEATYAGN